MRFVLPIILLPFVAFAVPGFAAGDANPKESLPCKLGYGALYDRVLTEAGTGKETRGKPEDNVEIFWLDDLKYTFTKPSHPAYPAVLLSTLYRTPLKNGELFIHSEVAGCSYGNMEAFHKALQEHQLQYITCSELSCARF